MTKKLIDRNELFKQLNIKSSYEKDYFDSCERRFLESAGSNDIKDIDNTNNSYFEFESKNIYIFSKEIDENEFDYFYYIN